VVALRTTAHREFARRTPEQLISGELQVFPGLGTNGRSIAASLGVPKETVRRKVCELIEAGWLARQGSRLYFTAKAYQELTPVREAMERLAVTNHKVVSNLEAKVANQAAPFAPAP
jgi:DNA-binding IclR family transcriptional regulator